MLRIQVPATSANLGAGFDALGLAVSLYNTVWMEETDQTVIRSRDGVTVPQGEDNLVFASAKRLFELCGKPFYGLRLEQESTIPFTRGLGSSSACIIAGLAGANRLLKEPLSTDELVDLAAKIEGHPDNTTPALLGGIVTSVIDGGRVYWVKQKVDSHLRFYAMIPDFEMKTEESRALLPAEVPYQTAVYNLSRAALFSASLLQGKYENLKIGVSDRLHQPYRLGRIPHSTQLMEGCYQAGAYAVYLSGAGPTIMAITAAHNDSFEKAVHRLYRSYELNWQLLELSIDNAGAVLTRE